MSQKDIEVVPGPWVIPEVLYIPPVKTWFEPQSDCLVEAFMRAEPNTRILGLVCPCPKCTTYCM
jgi:hypothetical protein